MRYSDRFIPAGAARLRMSSARPSPIKLMTSNPDTGAGALSRVVLIGALILMLSMGVRATAGILMAPMLATHGWSREFFSNAFAIQNLAWGLGAVLMGMLADRIGAVRTIALSGLIYAAGMLGTMWTESQAGLMLYFGLLLGIGQGGTSASLVMPMIGRATSPLARSAALGVANAGGSLGQFLVVPAGHLLIEWLDWSATLLILSMTVAVIAPLAFVMMPRASARAASQAPLAGAAPHTSPAGAAAPAGSATAAAAPAQPTLWQAVRDAFRRPAFALLAGSYFVCGFQLAFITLHLPAYVVDNGLAAHHGALAIALIGLFNVIGSFLVGWLGGRYSMKGLLGWVYALRAVFVVQLLVMPVSAFSLYLFSAGMGLLWLSTVPLTMGLVGQIFGLRYAATLGGFVFLSHQFGSAVGVWLAGRSYASTGNYDTMWYASIALALAAAVLAWLIDERPDAGGRPTGRRVQPSTGPLPKSESSLARVSLEAGAAAPTSNAYSSSIRSA